MYFKRYKYTKETTGTTDNVFGTLISIKAIDAYEHQLLFYQDKKFGSYIEGSLKEQCPLCVNINSNEKKMYPFGEQILPSHKHRVTYVLEIHKHRVTYVLEILLMLLLAGFLIFLLVKFVQKCREK